MTDAEVEQQDESTEQASDDGRTEKERLTGIMYSERQWVVQPWVKGVFFYCAIALLAGLVAYGMDKRIKMARLVMDSVVEPTPIKDIQAPTFSLPDGNTGEMVNLANLRGQWVFVNFWATWCPPCRDEMPSMEMLNRRFKDKGLTMVAISVDEDWNEVKRFFGDNDPSFKVLWDRTKKVSTGMYGTRKFPESYLISPDGQVAVKFIGPRDWYNIGTVKYFEEILSGKRDPTS